MDSGHLWLINLSLSLSQSQTWKIWCRSIHMLSISIHSTTKKQNKKRTIPFCLFVASNVYYFRKKSYSFLAKKKIFLKVSNIFVFVFCFASPDQFDFFGKIFPKTLFDRSNLLGIMKTIESNEMYTWIISKRKTKLYFGPGTKKKDAQQLINEWMNDNIKTQKKKEEEESSSYFDSND